MFKVERNPFGAACAISHDDQCVLHLVPGTEFNEKNVNTIVHILNISEEFADKLNSSVVSADHNSQHKG